MVFLNLGSIPTWEGNGWGPKKLSWWATSGFLLSKLSFCVCQPNKQKRSIMPFSKLPLGWDKKWMPEVSSNDTRVIAFHLAAEIYPIWIVSNPRDFFASRPAFFFELIGKGNMRVNWQLKWVLAALPPALDDTKCNIKNRPTSSRSQPINLHGRPIA